jgi:hypothetical protein
MRKLDELQAKASERSAVIYDILFRNAGVAIRWFEEARCTTPDPMTNDLTVEDIRAGRLREATETQHRRLEEGLVIYRYYESFDECIAGEFTRLKSVMVRIAE